MSTHKLTYFVSDVHLGLQVAGPADRERRFVDFLESLPDNTDALYLLGDVWDFWYEYRDVVPKGYVKVFAALLKLIERGVSVCFFQGNHDVWTYSYFEELGMKKLVQPCDINIGGKIFCLGHGDGLGPGVPVGYRFLRGIFHSRVLQFLFSMLHPWIAFRLGNNWSKGNRLARQEEYVFRGEDEPLYRFAAEYEKTHKVDCFIFGHFHTSVSMKTPAGADFLVLKDWMSSSPYICVRHSEDGAEIVR
ncbi:MAG: UDP-2,3-diacylglucosamine diphosphatase [Bacteroidales bacterium]|nr:UDP-2,3-diacylglucosamine diphosphatase [Bacteroidales bacterium]